MVPAVVLFLMALSGLDALWAVTLLACTLALVLMFLAFRYLGVNPFSPLSILRLIFKPASGGRREAIAAVACYGAALAVLMLIGPITRAILFLSDAVGGDSNLMLALAYSVGASVIAGTMFALHVKRRRYVADPRPAEVPTQEALDTLPGIELSCAYWKEVTISLVLVACALIPAALLANWAWNVLASLALPLFLQACRESHRAEVSGVPAS